MKWNGTAANNQTTPINFHFFKKEMKRLVCLVAASAVPGRQSKEINQKFLFRKFN